MFRQIARRVGRVLRGSVIGAGCFAVGFLSADSESSLYSFAYMPALRLLDAETAHKIAITAASYGFAPKDPTVYPELRTKVFGLELPNPIGLAAGFDKHAEAMDGMLGLGFGFIEIGSVTPEPQPGNPRPRMFRLTDDEAIINRYGFNSDGAQIVASRLQSWRHSSPTMIVGINLGKNKDQTDAAADYIHGVQQLGPYASYLVINVSSPNTPGLRALQGKKQLTDLIKKVIIERNKLPSKPPVLIKIAPDLIDADVKDIASVALETHVDGLIISNTTITRPASLESPHSLVNEAGGLSGKPLKDMSTQLLATMYKLTKGAIPIIGVGGVSSGADAYEKILNGASLVQIYSALAFEGPPLIPRVKRELSLLLQRDGYKHVADAVGKGVK